ncbi:MAG: DUF2064 domain-containing protein [Saprospiraceae bacterium]|nr:DUF2064 domain-containing protein [Lewinella sp.]
MWRRDLLNLSADTSNLFTIKRQAIHTAILIFSRSAREEAQIKQFGRHLSAAQNLQIAQRLIRRTRRMARRTRLPVFVVSGGQQQGLTFGERFTNAIASVFDKGFEHVISIGTDCPALHPQLLLQAARELENGKLVTGSDHSGGLYYLGLSREQFDQQALADLPWQSGQDFNAICRYVDQRGYKLTAGSVLEDVDNAGDLQEALQRLYRHAEMVRSLMALLYPVLPSDHSFFHYRSIQLHLLPFLRGPPPVV